MIRSLAAVFLCLLCLLPAVPVRAQDTVADAAIGTVAEVEGTAAVTSAGAQKELKTGTPVYQGDIIETAAGAKVMILFIDDTELTVAENAKLTVDEYVFDEQDTAANKGRFSVLRGAFIFVSGLIGKTPQPDVEIATPYGSIGLRGTTVWGGELEDAYNVFVQDGSVKFSTDRGTVTVAAGEGTSVASRRAIPARAKAWGQEKIGRAVKTIALANPDGVKLRVAQFKEQHTGLRLKHKENVRNRLLQKPASTRPEKRIENKPDQNAPLQNQPQQQKQPQQTPPQKSGAATPAQQPPAQARQSMEIEPTGNTAADFERREKKHLDGFGTPPGTKAPEPRRPALPSGR